VFLPIWTREEAVLMRAHATKIAIISDHASPLAAPGRTDAGGQNVYVAHVARELAARGHEVDVFTRRDDPGAPASQSLCPGVTVRNVTAGPAAPISKDDLLPHMSRFTDEVEAACLADGHEVLHANFWMSGLVAAAVKRRLGIPFIVTFHALGKIRRREQGDADGSPDLRIPIEEHIVRGADRIVAECPEEVRDLVELYGADPRRVSLVPAGFDPAAFAPIDRDDARRIVGLPAEAFVAVHVGRLVPRKGIAELLEGFARFRATFDGDARLVTVGGDDADPASRAEHDRLAGIAARLGIRDAVRFEGAVDRASLRPYYGAADVFATTPWYEPFGITPLEAMACGTPVLGTRVGGIGYTVVDGRTGWLVPPRDPGAIAERLAWFAAHRAGLGPMREAAVGRATHFRWSDVGAELDVIVRDVAPAAVMAAEAVS
jgi:D-inositol-3-phosphate glycosyltransferase